MTHRLNYKVKYKYYNLNITIFLGLVQICEAKNVLSSKTTRKIQINRQNDTFYYVAHRSNLQDKI